MFEQEMQGDFSIPEVGRQWRNYQIISELGRGGMGIVYKALQINPKRKVALKITKTTIKDKEKKRFEREIEITAQLDHKNIIKVYSIEKYQDILILVMEYVPAIPLSTFLKENELSLENKISIMIEICRGLRHAHNKNIIHRDLKPANILITKQHIPKIIDFGIARDLNSEFALTKTGEILGTPYYMAPEQLLEKNTANKQADVYAMGAIFYEILTGERMISGESHVQVFYNIQYPKVQPPSYINKELNTNIDRVWQIATAKKQNIRYANIDKMIVDLKKLLYGKKITQKNSPNKVILCFTTLFIFSIFFFVWQTYPKTKDNVSIQLEEHEIEILNFLEQKKYFEAMQLYNKHPQNFLYKKIASFYYKIHQDALQQENSAKKQKYLEMVTAFFPYDVEILYSLSLTYLPEDSLSTLEFEVENENLNKSKECLQKCASLNPYDYKYFFLLGKIFFAQQQYEHAYQNFTKANNLNPEYKNAIEFITRIPHHSPELSEKCYRYAGYSLTDIFDAFSSPNLYEEELYTISQQDEERYYKYLLHANIKQNETELESFLKKVLLYEFNERLADEFLSFRYHPSFFGQTASFLKKFPNQNLQRLVEKAKLLLQEEAEGYFSYVISYIFKNKSWQLKLEYVEDEKFHNFLIKIIKKELATDSFTMFKANKVYIERYGIGNTLDILGDETINLESHIILTASLRLSFIPVEINSFFEIAKEPNLKNNNFVHYLVADALFVFHRFAENDTFGRNISPTNTIEFTNQERNLWEYLKKLPHQKIQIAIAASLFSLLDSENFDENGDTEKFKWARDKLRAGMEDGDEKISRYSHYYFWRSQNTLRIDKNTEKHAQEFANFIKSEGNLKAKKAVLLYYHRMISFHNWEHQIRDILKQCKEKELHFELIVTLISANFLDMDTLLKHISSYSDFEKAYFCIKFILNIRREPRKMQECIDPFIRLMKTTENRYLKRFGIYLFSVLGLTLPLSEKQDDKIVIYTLFHQNNNTSLLTNLFGSSLIKETYAKQRFAKDYMNSPNPSIKKIAMISYISLFQNDNDRFKYAKEVHLDENQEKTIFFRLLKQKILQKQTSGLPDVDKRYNERYLYYLDLLKNKVGLLKREKELVSYILKFKNLKDPEYKIEQILVNKLLKKSTVAETLKYIEQAIENCPYEEYLNLYYFEKALLFLENKDKEQASFCLDKIKLQEISSKYWLINIGRAYLDTEKYEKAANIYSKLLLREYSLHDFPRYLILVGIYANTGKLKRAKTMYKIVSELEKRYQYKIKKTQYLSKKRLDSYIRKNPVIGRFRDDLFEIME